MVLSCRSRTIRGDGNGREGNAQLITTKPISEKPRRLKEADKHSGGITMRLLFSVALLLAVALDIVSSNVSAEPPARASNANGFDYPGHLEIRPGEVRYATRVIVGETFLSVPFRYTRTGILQNTISTLPGTFQSRIVAPRGAEAFWVGQFGQAGRQSQDAWCFVWSDEPNPSPVPSINNCVVGRFQVPISPFIQKDFSGSAIRTNASPNVLLAPLEIGADLRLDYQLERVSADSLQYRISGGWPVEVQRAASGVYIVPTVIGPVQIADGNGDVDAVVVRPDIPGNQFRNTDRELISTRTEHLAQLPQPVLIADAALSPSPTEFRTATPGSILLEQTVRPASQSLITRGRIVVGSGRRIDRRGEYLTSFDIAGDPMLCDQPNAIFTHCYPVENGRITTNAYVMNMDYTENSGLFFRPNSLLRGLTRGRAAYPLREVQPATTGPDLSEIVQLVYRGERLSSSQRYAVVSWRTARNRDTGFAEIGYVATPFDENGIATISTKNGEGRIEVRLRQGSAEYRVVSPLPSRPFLLMNTNALIEGARMEYILSLQAE